MDGRVALPSDSRPFLNAVDERKVNKKIIMEVSIRSLFFLASLLLLITSTESVRSKSGCAVCGKKSQPSAFLTVRPYVDEIPSCFNVDIDKVNSWKNDRQICDLCRRAVLIHRQTGKTFFHYVDLNLRNGGRPPKHKQPFPAKKCKENEEMIKIPKQELEEMEKAIEKLSHRCDMKTELELVKSRIQQQSKKIPIYDPDNFKELCQSSGAKNIFDCILDAVTSRRHSKDRIALNKKRVVTIIYKLCHCLSQTCNHFEIDNSLYLKTNNINQEGIETQHILGNTCSRRTVNNMMNTLANRSSDSFETFIREAIQNQWLLVLIIDDFTAIHSKQRPQNEDLSQAKSMCTIVVKAFKDIKAIPIKQVNIMHNSSGINISECINTITSASSLHDLSKSYASVMPDWVTYRFFSQESARDRLNTHRYCDNDNIRTMRKMDNLYLLEFIELQLKSKEDFSAAFDVVMGTGLADYMKKFVLIQPGDWPCQFYCRQNIYSCLQKFNTFNPLTSPSQDSNINHFLQNDHCAYSYPSSVDSHPVSGSACIPPQQPALLSIIPTIGPLHISRVQSNQR